MSVRFASIAELVAGYVADGQCVALEGLTHLIPFAAAHEVIRQRRRGLHLVPMTPVLVYDQMIGAGSASELPFGVLRGYVGRGLANVNPQVRQAGRVDVGFLGAAQIDRHGNLSTTVIGDYPHPDTRLSGAGDAPEIAQHAKQTFIVLKQSPRNFVEKLDFVTSAGLLGGHGERSKLRLPGAGPQVVISDLGVFKPDPDSEELTLLASFCGFSVDRIRRACGWPLACAAEVRIVPEPTTTELLALRDLQQRTRQAYAHSHAHARRNPSE